MKLECIKISQSVGDYFITKLSAKSLLGYINKGNISLLRGGKINANKNVENTNLLFANRIIIALDSKYVSIAESEININDALLFGELIDGYYQIEELMSIKNIDNIDIPITCIVDTSFYEKAYIVSSSNLSKIRLSDSSFSELFCIDESRTLGKVTHTISMLLNMKKESPFYTKLPLLSRFEENTLMLNQSIFRELIIKIISNNEWLLHKYTKGEEEVIYKILFNLFTAINKVLPDEFNKFLRLDSTIVQSILDSLNTIITLGSIKKDLTTNFFIEGFEIFKCSVNELKNKNINIEELSYYCNLSFKQLVTK